MKDETYPEYKHARGINSRTDVFKCRVGPIFKAIESVVYSHPSFIKHVPVSKRPSYIKDKLYALGRKYFATDYTAFEALFVKEVMECVEFELYDWMTFDLPSHEEFMRTCREDLAGLNHCEFKWFWVELQATRMSGEMCTSLGNGFANLMFMLFLCQEVGSTFVDGVVEGDDGLFVISGPAPSKADFESIGLIIKLEVHDQLSNASFCGIIFDETDCINVRDPRRVLTTFGWTSARYAKARTSKLRILLRAKSLSLAYQYPGCPIIQALAHYGLRMTEGVTAWQLIRAACAAGVNEYQRDVLRQAIRAGNPCQYPTGIRTRLLVERMFNITVEAQIRYEAYLEGLSEIQPLDPLFLDVVLPAVSRDYTTKYVMPSPANILYPGIRSRQLFVVREVEDLIRR